MGPQKRFSMKLEGSAVWRDDICVSFTESAWVLWAACRGGGADYYKKKKKRKEKYAGELEGSNVGAMTARQVKLQRRVK